MSTRDDDMLLHAVRHAVESITADIKARELLREHEGDTLADLDPEPGEDRVGDDLRCSIDAARDTLELGPIDDDTDVAEGLDDLTGWIDDALEIRREGFNYGSGWQVERVRVCVGLGGPNIFVFTDGSSAWVDGYWGGSKVEAVHFTTEAASAIAADLDYYLNEVEA